MSALTVRDLSVEYSEAGYLVRAIDSLSVEAADGELVILLGPSGCGKTTLLSCLAAILTPTSGTISLGDTVVTDLRGRALDHYRTYTVGLVFQAFNLISSLTAAENVQVPMRLAGVSRQEARRRAQELLAKVGLGDRTRHRPGRLSGGQQQRVAIARALAHEPVLVLADEPTAHLDYIQVEGVFRLIRELASPGRMVVVATHDDRITALADRVVDLAPRGGADLTDEKTIVLDAGQVVFEQGSRGELVYIVESGQIEIYRIRGDRREEHLRLVGPGEYFGELGPMLGLPRSASARARTGAVLVASGVRHFRQRQGRSLHPRSPEPTGAAPVRPADEPPSTPGDPRSTIHLAPALDGKGGPVPEHPNVFRTRAAMAAYAQRDFDTMATYLADDIVWHVGGDHRYSGVRRGKADVLAYFDEMQAATGGTLNIEPKEILANDQRGVAFLRATAERDGRTLDVLLAEAFVFDDHGRWKEFWALANDQAAVDAFWDQA